MTSFDLNLTSLRSLKDKVIVLTGSPVSLVVHPRANISLGGANGIGAATVDLLVEQGAQVIFGDLDASSGENVAAKHGSERVKFVPTDVTKYEDHVALFKLALEKYGRVDHALSIAGIVERGNIFDPALTIEDVEKVLTPGTNPQMGAVGTLTFVSHSLLPKPS